MDEMQSYLKFCYDSFFQLRKTTNMHFKFYTYNILMFILNYDKIKSHVKFTCINEWLFCAYKY